MRTDTIGKLIFSLAVLFLAFIAGAMVVLSRVPPYTFLNDAYMAGAALFDQKAHYRDPLQTDLWIRARTTQKGVTINHPQLESPGYTLYTSADGPYARLIDMNGRVVHEWRRPYSTIWNESADVEHPRPDDFIYMRQVRLLPNGDLIALYIASGDTPWGYGIAKLDANSNLIWTYLAHTHHDFDIAPDGRIYVLTHEFTSAPITATDLKYLDKPYLEDFLVILSPDGKQLKKISLLNTLVRSDYTEPMLNATPFYADFDPLHPNSVQFINADLAAAFPFARAGDVLISFRQIAMLAVLDPRQEKFVWGALGPWLGQHDATLLDNGDILLFDNLGYFKAHNRSRALQFDPKSMRITWSYTGTKEHPLDSRIRSGVQRLPNGNTLITESDGGRLVEVTPDDKIAWEYINPVRYKDDAQYIPVVSSGQRIDPASLDPEFRAELEAAERKANAAAQHDAASQ